jgi:hypothetical protein
VAAHGTGNGAASAAGLGGLLHVLGGLLPDVTLPKNNNDWQ